MPTLPRISANLVPKMPGDTLTVNVTWTYVGEQSGAVLRFWVGHKSITNQFASDVVGSSEPGSPGYVEVAYTMPRSEFPQDPPYGTQVSFNLSEIYGLDQDIKDGMVKLVFWSSEFNDVIQEIEDAFIYNQIPAIDVAIEVVSVDIT